MSNLPALYLQLAIVLLVLAVVGPCDAQVQAGLVVFGGGCHPDGQQTFRVQGNLAGVITELQLALGNATLDRVEQFWIDFLSCRDWCRKRPLRSIMTTNRVAGECVPD